jgi:hypothetical protein
VDYWSPQRAAWETALQQHEQQAERVLDELHAAFALPEVEYITDLLPELVGIIGEFLSTDSRPAEYVSIHALPKAAHQQQQQQQLQQQQQSSAPVAAHSSSSISSAPSSAAKAQERELMTSMDDSE